MKIEAILFDCFGVLYPDTYWTTAHRHLGADLSGKKTELSDLVKRVDLGHITRDELWGELAELAGISKDQLYAELKDFGGLDKQLLQFIESHKNDYKFGMISNVGHGFIEKMFTDKPVGYYFDSVVLSSDVGLVKPDKRIYELSSLQLGVPAENCVFIDDLPKNVEGAKNAGMQAILYKSYPQFIDDISLLL
jgi:epoxide hydrolase-like predicted phosphatase